MIDYEEFLSALQPAQKALRDAAESADRWQRALQKSLDSGNLAEAKKCLAALAEAAARLEGCRAELSRRVEGLDAQEYFASGDFSRQLLEACRARGMDVSGEKGVYEVFPFRVRVYGDREHPAEVYVNRKKLPSIRPAFVAEAIAAARGKLYAAPFRAPAFMAELAEAYETSCLKSGKRPGAQESLTKIYRCLAPTARARRDYDMQAFAFDLARLYEAGPEAWADKDGIAYAFGTSRDGKNAIRVLSRAGTESYISTLRQLGRAEE